LKSSISALWSAKSVAIIGATERAGAMGRLPLEYLQKYRFAGEIFPVNPKGGEVLGLKAFENVKNIGKKIDLALIMVPANFVKEAVQDCADAKVGVAQKSRRRRWCR